MFKTWLRPCLHASHFHSEVNPSTYVLTEIPLTRLNVQLYSRKRRNQIYESNTRFSVWHANKVRIMAKINRVNIQNAVFGIFLSGFNDVKHPFSVRKFIYSNFTQV